VGIFVYYYFYRKVTYSATIRQKIKKKTPQNRLKLKNNEYFCSRKLN